LLPALQTRIDINAIDGRRTPGAEIAVRRAVMPTAIVRKMSPPSIMMSMAMRMMRRPMVLRRGAMGSLRPVLRLRCVPGVRGVI